MAGDGGPRPKVTPKLLLGALLFGRKFERLLVDATRDEFTPEGVPPMDSRAAALLDAAWGLAGDDEWSDVDAVAELRRLAGRHRSALKVAEVNSRAGGGYTEFVIENRGQRLLEAAVTGEPPRVLTPEEQQRLRWHDDDEDDR